MRRDGFRATRAGRGPATCPSPLSSNLPGAGSKQPHPASPCHNLISSSFPFRFPYDFLFDSPVLYIIVNVYNWGMRGY